MFKQHSFQLTYLYYIHPYTQIHKKHIRTLLMCINFSSFVFCNIKFIYFNILIVVKFLLSVLFIFFVLLIVEWHLRNKLLSPRVVTTDIWSSTNGDHQHIIKPPQVLNTYELRQIMSYPAFSRNITVFMQVLISTVSVLDVTLDCIWWWESSSGALGNVEYPFIAITFGSRMVVWSGLVLWHTNHCRGLLPNWFLYI